tara:strand:+ start:120 stop:278 length:159 start_codon:yes stop_codon:yes gene_type:complete
LSDSFGEKELISIITPKIVINNNIKEINLFFDILKKIKSKIRAIIGVKIINE